MQFSCFYKKKLNPDSEIVKTFTGPNKTHCLLCNFQNVYQSW